MTNGVRGTLNDANQPCPKSGLVGGADRKADAALGNSIEPGRRGVMPWALGCPRAYAEVDPGEPEALLRVERSA